jgi:hypothetical protein
VEGEMRREDARIVAAVANFMVDSISEDGGG